MKRLPFLFALFCLGCSVAAAHETWLSPSRFLSDSSAPLTISLTSGMNFPTLDHAIREERVASANFRLGAKTYRFPKPVSAKAALEFQLAAPRAGLIVAWMVLHPKTLELNENKIAEYFEEINAAPDIRAQWANLKSHERWRETYTKCAKTYVTVGQTPADDSWKNPVGLSSEIVPLDDPTNLRVGNHFSLRLLREGRPLPRASVGAIQNGVRVFQPTNAEGVAVFPLQGAGPVLFYAVQLKRHGHKWLSTFTTLSLPVHDAM